MLPKNRILIWIISVISIITLLGLYIKLEIYDPNMKISDSDFFYKSTPEELRETSHKVLKWSFGDAHDAFLALIECGDESSVPVLINALRWQPVIPIL